MEDEQSVQEAENQKSFLTEVTTLSKYLAMTLFIVMPFAGAWVGYRYAPEKIVEVERSGVQPAEKSDLSIALKKYVSTEFNFEFKYPKFYGFGFKTEDNNEIFLKESLMKDDQNDLLTLYFCSDISCGMLPQFLKIKKVTPELINNFNEELPQINFEEPLEYLSKKDLFIDNEPAYLFELEDGSSILNFVYEDMFFVASAESDIMSVLISSFRFEK